MLESIGKIVVNPKRTGLKPWTTPHGNNYNGNWIVVELVNNQLTQLIKYFFEKSLMFDCLINKPTLIEPSWGSHVSIVRGESIENKKVCDIDNGRLIRFKYELDIHMSLDIKSPNRLLSTGERFNIYNNDMSLKSITDEFGYNITDKIIGLREEQYPLTVYYNGERILLNNPGIINESFIFYGVFFHIPVFCHEFNHIRLTLGLKSKSKYHLTFGRLNLFPSIKKEHQILSYPKDYNKNVCCLKKTNILQKYLSF